MVKYIVFCFFFFHTYLLYNITERCKASRRKKLLFFRLFIFSSFSSTFFILSPDVSKSFFFQNLTKCLSVFIFFTVPGKKHRKLHYIFCLFCLLISLCHHLVNIQPSHFETTITLNHTYKKIYKAV